MEIADRTIAKVALLSGALALIFLACTSVAPPSITADRDAINKEMPLVAEYENKRTGVRQAIRLLVTHGAIDRMSGAKVKEAMDIEYVYYEASLVSLAHGQMERYRSFVHLAEAELDRVRNVLGPHLQALDQGSSRGMREESHDRQPERLPKPEVVL